MRFLFALTFLLTALLFASMSTAEDEYIHLPGKTCKDAPPCPDGRPCVMAKPRCNVGTCGNDPVPTCGSKP
ncbi:uncharacterized protein LOC143175245 [Nomia melanderi]|uniref:uncharacterized protein LOC143175245 n=1 Tax=Nomia melanderi TaxID=2448451 RepID=UPI003FCCFF0D